MKTQRSYHEKGQSIVIIAVILVVLIGLSALVLDGGLGYAKRREAQNAADAAALAGADLLCGGATTTEVRDMTEEYVLRNGGNQPAIEDIIISSDTVTVTAYMTHPTFFAGIFGSEEINTSATAAAGCFSPCVGTGVLPIAWACSPPAGGSGSDGECPDIGNETDPDCTCVVETGSLGPPLDPTPLYVIMDSRDVNTDFNCQDPPNSGLPANTLDCDINNDGYNDVLAGGDRSWLDLSGGGGGASDMSNWVVNGYPGIVEPHYWLAGQSGVANSVFQSVEDRRLVNPIVVLPVFDMFCDGAPNTTAGCTYHTDDDTIVYTSASSQLYFHVSTLSVFYITCVEAPGVPGNPDCPGKNAAQAANPGLIPENTKSIEGFFIEGYIPGLSGACEGNYSGAYTIYLK